jgi:hypothetical protein
VRGDEEQTELRLGTIERGSVEVALETSEKLGDVKGASIGRLIEVSVWI